MFFAWIASVYWGLLCVMFFEKSTLGEISCTGMFEDGSFAVIKVRLLVWI